MKRLILVGVLSALFGANVDKLPDLTKTFNSTAIHEGVLKSEKDGNYVFDDGTSFIIKDVNGMVPLNTKVRLCKSAFGNYYFEVVK